MHQYLTLSSGLADLSVVDVDKTKQTEQIQFMLTELPTK